MREWSKVIDKDNIPVIAEGGEYVHIGKYTEYRYTDNNEIALRNVYPLCKQSERITICNNGRPLEGQKVTCVQCKRLIRGKK